jgi:carboxyl-terminal processing protease
VKAKVRQARRVTDLQNDTDRDAWSLRLEEEDERRLTRPQYRELSNGLMILKLPLFDLTAAAVDEIIRKAPNHDTLIVDVRGNPGGAEHTLQDLLGGLFEKEVKIANRVTRESPKPVVAKPQHNVFTGKLIVLVDSNSASASELLARVVQIERRGIVMGDRTSGSVMEAKFYSHRIGSQPYFYYGTEISEADLVMTDGNSLEHTGVIPDEAKLPVATDLANKLDPVLAHAAETAGAVLTPEQAGSLFPFEWPKR